MTEETIDYNSIEDSFEQLNTKAEVLNLIYEKIEPLIELDDYDSEINIRCEYWDKI